MTENTFTCDHCGSEYPAEQCISLDGEDICAACAEEETRICSICGERIWQDNNAGDEDTQGVHEQGGE